MREPTRGAARVAAAVLAVLAGCDDGSTGDTESTEPMPVEMAEDTPEPVEDAEPEGESEAEPAEPEGLTFYGDVQPIIAQNCQGCHQPGGIGPFDLLSYEDVSVVAPLVKSATSNRTMPPFLPDNSGSCATYHDAMWLEQPQIDQIGEWIDTGMLEGDPDMAIEAPTLTQLDDATHLAEMPVEYSPSAELADDYRCFVLDDDIPDDITTYITDYEIVPGDNRVVHHAIVYQPTSDEAVAQARASDDGDPGPGYSCFGGAGTSVRMLLNWSPGTGVTRHPEGTGVIVDPGYPLVMQIHYNLANGSFPDRTAIRLKIAEQVAYPMRPIFVAGGALELEPGEEEIVVERDVPGTQVVGIGAVPGIMMGVRAHMHGAGIRMKVERLREEADDVCLVDIPRYDYGWQRSYFLMDPVHLDGADQLRITCVYDTTDRTELTTWGEGTSDEMCLATIYLIRRPLE